MAEDVYPHCTRVGSCWALSWQHSPSCLALVLTDVEQDTGVVPSDDELRRRRDILDGHDMPSWASPHPYLTPAQRLLDST